MKIAHLPQLMLVASAIHVVSAFQHIVVPTHHVGRVLPLRLPQRNEVPQHFATISTDTSSRSTRLQMVNKKSADEKVKDRISFGHQISSFLFMAVTLTIIYLGIDGPVSMGLPLFGASGPYLAAGVSTILSDAASADRLRSAPYKRLALFQTEFDLCAISTILLALDGTSPRDQVFYGLSLAGLLSLSPSLAGYRNGDPNLKSEIGDTIKGFFSCKNFNAFIYLTGTWFVATLKLLKLVEMANLIKGGNPAKTIVIRAVRFGRLALLTGVIYTLKDAADRDKLGETTFIDLNLLSSIVLGCMAFYVKTTKGIKAPLLWATAGFSAFTGFNGLASAVRKSG